MNERLIQTPKSNSTEKLCNFCLGQGLSTCQFGNCRETSMATYDYKVGKEGCKCLQMEEINSEGKIIFQCQECKTSYGSLSEAPGSRVTKNSKSNPIIDIKN